MRYLARISYDGSKFMGFQRLNNGRGVQNVLENVLSKIENQKVLVKGAGRTDALVHAFDQCVHFDLERSISVNQLQFSMNQMLPDFISVNSISIVDNSFHARHSVKSKTYLYQVYCGEKNPFLSSYAYCISYKLNLEKMIQASQYFVGLHDFHHFVSGHRDNYESVIDSLQIYYKDDFLMFEVKGKSFYRYMVRRIVGALLDVGRNHIDLECIKLALENPVAPYSFFVAPACGLYLKKIDY